MSQSQSKAFYSAPNTLASIDHASFSFPQAPSLKSPNRFTNAIGLKPSSSPSQSVLLLTPVNTANVPPNFPSIPNLISVSTRSPTIHALSLSNRNLPSIASIIAWLGFPSATGFLPIIASNGATQAPAPGKSAPAEGSVTSMFVAKNTAPRCK